MKHIAAVVGRHRIAPHRFPWSVPGRLEPVDRRATATASSAKPNADRGTAFTRLNEERRARFRAADPTDREAYREHIARALEAAAAAAPLVGDRAKGW
jgi:hypothetical protein